ncbi:hypothetical protein TNCV_3583921 [Trichonephila clavipes]|nr:hypothetical protein TNCV_3583921 [Trichonephila clavipes]
MQEEPLPPELHFAEELKRKTKWSVCIRQQSADTVPQIVVPAATSWVDFSRVALGNCTRFLTMLNFETESSKEDDTRASATISEFPYLTNMRTCRDPFSYRLQAAKAGIKMLNE